MKHFARESTTRPGTCVECGDPVATAPQGVTRHLEELLAQLARLESEHKAGRHGTTEREADMYAGFGCSACIEKEW